MKKDNEYNPKEFTEEDIRRMGEYARSILYPTPDEVEESKQKLEAAERQFKARMNERSRRIREAYAKERKTKKLKFFGIGWWYE